MDDLLQVAGYLRYAYPQYFTSLMAWEMVTGIYNQGASNWRNLSYLPDGERLLTTGAATVGNLIGVGDIEDARSGRNAVGNRLGWGTRIFHGARGLASVAATVVGGLKSIPRTAIAAEEVAVARLSSTELRVASDSAGEFFEASRVRTIAKGETVKDLIQEVAQRTYETGGMEHAIVSLKDGTRIIVRGGPDGIIFSDSSIRRIILHTHPSPTGPSGIDFKMLDQLKQQSSYIYELFGGGLTKFWR